MVPQDKGNAHWLLRNGPSPISVAIVMVTLRCSLLSTHSLVFKERKEKEKERENEESGLSKSKALTILSIMTMAKRKA